ncbi:unnamed protein product [Lactuca saligna]|uniref:Uncharacterized protein n=1 Tax=Lactuca saligna TaxID=75948 RepID=A0AA35Y645_LACSI|nr:unnamed protein product [Lactuca saligna]
MVDLSKQVIKREKKKRQEISPISKIPPAIGFRFEQFQQGIEPFLTVLIMCRLVASEDTSTGELEHHQSTVNGTRRMHPQIQAQIARLEARISRVEARMERLEWYHVVMFDKQK